MKLPRRPLIAAFFLIIGIVLVGAFVALFELGKDFTAGRPASINLIAAFYSLYFLGGAAAALLRNLNGRCLAATIAHVVPVLGFAVGGAGLLIIEFLTFAIFFFVWSRLLRIERPLWKGSAD